MNFLDAVKWKEAGAPAGALVSKQVPLVIKREGKALRLEISNESPDRDNDVIVAAGCRLENFLKNPVVLWAHEYRGLPIAKAPKTRTENGRVVSEPEFAPKELYPFAHTVKEMLEQGFLNAASIGMKPLRYARNDERGGYDFLEWELLEYSICPVPANAGALVINRGVDDDGFRKWLEEPLVQIDGGDEGLSEEEIQRTLRAIPSMVEQAVGQELQALTGKLFDPAPIGGGQEFALDFDPEELAGIVREATDAAIRGKLTEMTGRLD